MALAEGDTQKVAPPEVLVEHKKDLEEAMAIPIDISDEELESTQVEGGDGDNGQAKQEVGEAEVTGAGAGP
eukprot:5794203-Alexandrium_andersonii.AAC.1